MKANINLIAEKCGVSKATVSRVFNRRAGVSNSVKEQILHFAREMNYMPKQVAAQENIAIVVDSMNKFRALDGFYLMLVIAIITEFTRFGYQVRTVELKDVELLGPHTKAAILIIDEKKLELEEARFRKLPIPLLAVNLKSQYCHLVRSDHAQGIELATEHLIENGHKRITLLLDRIDIWAGHERLRGYLETMTRHSLQPLKEYVYYPKKQSLVELIAILLKDHPTALIISGESLTAEAAYCLNLLNVRIPEDLSVIGYEKDELSRWLSPPQTTIDQDVFAIADEMLELIRQVTQKTSNKELSFQIKMLPNRLIIRDSVKNLFKA